jgi:hypothetical protein
MAKKKATTVDPIEVAELSINDLLEEIEDYFEGERSRLQSEYRQVFDLLERESEGVTRHVEAIKKKINAALKGEKNEMFD